MEFTRVAHNMPDLTRYLVRDDDGRMLGYVRQTLHPIPSTGRRGWLAELSRFGRLHPLTPMFVSRRLAADALRHAARDTRANLY